METATTPIPQSLESEATFRQMIGQAQALNQADETGEAQDFLQALESSLKTANLQQRSAELTAAYEPVLTYLRWVCLPLLPERETLNLFRSQVVAGLKTDVDLKTKIDVLLLLYHDGLTSQRLSQAILHALTENDELIGREPLTIPELPGPTQPSIRSWIIDFVRTTATGQPLTALEIARFFSQSPNIQTLGDEDRELLRQVLTLYLYILNPPLQAVSARLATRRPAAPTPQDFRSYLLQSLYEESAREEAIYAEEERLLAGGRFSLSGVLAALKDSLATKNHLRTQAALFLLARSGDLASLLAHDQELRQRVERDLLPAMLPVVKQQRPGVELRDLIDDFRRQPLRPVYLAAFLESVLTKTTRGDREQAAQLGVRLAGLLFRQGYTEAAAIAYFDADQRKYRWGQFGVDSQGVPILV